MAPALVTSAWINCSDLAEKVALPRWNEAELWYANIRLGADVVRIPRFYCTFMRWK